MAQTGSNAKNKGRKGRKEVWKCKLCKHDFKNDDDKLLVCDKCDLPCCIKCTNINEEEYKTLGSSKAMWFCPECRIVVETNIATEKKIEERCKLYLDTLNKRMEDLETKLDSKVDKEEVEDLRSEVATKCSKVEVKASVKEELKGQEMKDLVKNTVTEEIRNIRGTGENREVGAIGGTDKTEIGEKDTVSETMNEINERMRREGNILVYNIPESSKNSKEERIQEDKETIKGLMEILNVDFRIEELKSTPKRLGVFKDLEEGKSRPLLVQFKSSDKKKGIFRNIKNLKDAQEPSSKLSIINDMTPQQRSLYRQLHAEARAKQDLNQEDTVFRVRGPPGKMKIVEIPKPQ
jgi:hypothetical protein